jgi:hypothetical protein
VGVPLPRPVRLLGAAALALALALLGAGGAPEARACAVCGAGDPTLTVMGTEKPFAGRFRLAADVRFGGVWAGQPGVSEIDVTEQRFDLTAAYAPIPRLFLTLDLPVMRRIIHEIGSSAVAYTPGDIELRAKIFIASLRRGPYLHQLALQTGVKLPTALEEHDAKGVALAAPLQPGCGAVAPELGAFYGLGRGPFSFYASAVIYLPYAVRQGPHASDSFRTSAAAQWQAHPRIAARIGFETRLDATAETVGGATDPNSGGFVGYVAPEVVVSPATDLLLHVGAHFPAIQALQGFHRERTIVGVGATYDF